MNCAFMASDAVAIPAMKMLSDRGLLKCVVSNPDRPKGRGKKLSPNAAAAWALENSIPLIRPENTPSSETLDFFKSFGVDCVVVMAYGKILREEILDFPKLGCLNLHASLLPRLRGASPIETAMAIGDSQTGVTLMRVVKKMDAGDMGAKTIIPIGARETGAGLRQKVADSAASLLEANLSAIENSTLVFEPQNEAEVTYARKLLKQDMFLDFRKSARELDCRIRAFGVGLVPWRGDTLRICEALPEDAEMEGEAGSLAIFGASVLKVKCGVGLLNVLKIQAPCAKAVSVAEFLNGHSVGSAEVWQSSENMPLIQNVPFKKLKL